LRFHLTTNGHEWMRIYNLFALFAVIRGVTWIAVLARPAR
jgi:hypothetical protein